MSSEEYDSSSMSDLNDKREYTPDKENQKPVSDLN